MINCDHPPFQDAYGDEIALLNDIFNSIKESIG